jgi:hypothetical protein
LAHQIISLVGAFLILLAYGANQIGVMGPYHRAYNLINLVGAGLLLWIAFVDWRWGFIVLEAAWILISLPRLIAPAPRRDPNPVGS